MTAEQFERAQRPLDFPRRCPEFAVAGYHDAERVMYLVAEDVDDAQVAVVLCEQAGCSYIAVEPLPF